MGKYGREGCHIWIERLTVVKMFDLAVRKHSCDVANKRTCESFLQ